ncbi:MAG: DUF3303 family protein [Dehalococcoidia bacterium]|jgi:hypothetical protein
MLYLASFTWKPGLTRQQTDAALGRRAQYKFPAGFEWVAEYWPAGPTIVVVVFEAANYAPVMQFLIDWDDVFDVVVYPTTTPEEGLKLGAEAIQRRPAA